MINIDQVCLVSFQIVDRIICRQSSWVVSQLRILTHRQRDATQLNSTSVESRRRCVLGISNQLNAFDTRHRVQKYIMRSV